MKQNMNIFIMIGVIALFCGQLQGLTRREFFELDQLKQKLNMRYDAGMPDMGQGDWLDENIEIIEKIRRLDRPTAATYQEEQDMFAEAVQEERKFLLVEEEVAKIEDISISKAEPMQAKIEALRGDIAAELSKSPRRYNEVNFDPFFLKISDLKNEIELEKKGFTDEELKDLLLEVDKLPTQLANSIVSNLTKLIPRMTKQIDEMKGYIEKLQKSTAPFNFDTTQIEDPVSWVVGHLEAAYQGGLLLAPDVVNKVVKKHWEDVSAKVKNDVLAKANILYDQLIAYVYNLNLINKANKDEKEIDTFTVNNFNITAQAIKAINLVIENLYSTLQGTLFGDGDKHLIADLSTTVRRQRERLSGLKTDLYKIYGVKQESNNKIEVLYYGNMPAFDEDSLYYSDSQDDPLADILPNLADIVRE